MVLKIHIFQIYGLLIKGHLPSPKGSPSSQLQSEQIFQSHDDIIEELFIVPSADEENGTYSKVHKIGSRLYTNCEFQSDLKPLQAAANKQKDCSTIKTAHTRVYVWGLNDKDQLGGPKGSKIKTPEVSDAISSLKVAQVAGGSKSLFIVTQEGKVEIVVLDLR